MDKGKALELLKQALTQVPHLKKLRHGNQDFKLWRDKARDIIQVAFPDDFTRFSSWRSTPYVGSDDEFQEAYIGQLTNYETALKSIIQKYELLGIEIKPAAEVELPPKAFIAHGGKSEARDKLCRFLNAIGVTPLIIEEEPKEGRSVNEQVEYYSEQADCATILGTADDKELKDGKLYPRRNVYIEIGRFQEKFPKRIIYLLEEGASFPSDISEKLYTPFTKDSMDEAFITIVRELKKFGILRAIKP
jgi:hypothetical protein